MLTNVYYQKNQCSSETHDTRISFDICTDDTIVAVYWRKKIAKQKHIFCCTKMEDMQLFYHYVLSV